MITDPFLTTCPEAADQYRLGLERLLAGDLAAAEQRFAAAVGHDPGFALGQAALAVTLDDEVAVAAPLARARMERRRVSRRERQQVSIVELVLTGQLPRASALGREHLAEFPEDELILHVLARHCGDLDDLKR